MLRGRNGLNEKIGTLMGSKFPRDFVIWMGLCFGLAWPILWDICKLKTKEGKKCSLVVKQKKLAPA